MNPSQPSDHFSDGSDSRSSLPDNHDHMDRSDADFTVLLQRLQNGDESATSELFLALSAHMRTAAQALMYRERIDHTLQASALINEAVLKLLASDVFQTAQDRLFLFGAINRAMRQVLIDHARRRNADKRPQGHARSPLDHVLDTLAERDRTNIFELTDALDHLRVTNPRQVQVTELSFFSGLEHQQIASLLDISVATVKRDLLVARARLAEILNPD